LQYLLMFKLIQSFSQIKVQKPPPQDRP
jgi:hypothetical protein